MNTQISHGGDYVHLNRTLSIFIWLLLVNAAGLAAEGEWVSLFNGQDLDGWQQINGNAKYEVKDGAILGTSVPNSANSFLCTKKHYGDFELEFEVKVDKELNSGVQIRSHSKPDYQQGRVHGYRWKSRWAAFPRYL